MKLEQACRFATSDSGYRIFAQSEGFSEQNAYSMTSVFNDVMNSVFGKVGQSMITLNISNNNVFFARLTLRSDIKSRKAMFTNAVVIPDDLYSKMMREDPTWMLHFPYKDLLSQRPGNERMDAIELNDYEPEKDVLVDICSEYDLDKPALTEFIIQLYRAVMEGTSLCLATTLDSSRTPDLIVKYAALAAAVLPSSLRRMFTFSSMGDARCVLCVQPKDGGELLSMGKEIYRFRADKEKRIVYNNGERAVNMQDGMVDMFVNFANLLSEKTIVDKEGQKKFLYDLDKIADKISGTGRGCFSFELLIIAYYVIEKNETSLVEAVYLINALLQYSQENPTDDSVVNKLLSMWTDLLSDASVCANIRITAPLTVRAIDQKDKHLYESVDRMLKYAADDTRTGLAQIILRKNFSELQKDLVNELLIENPAPWSDELLEMLFAWSCRYNIIDLASVIWTRKNKQISRQADNESETAGLLHRLIKDNVEQEQGLQYWPEGELLFNECEMFYMSNGLSEMCDYVNSERPDEVLSDAEVQIVSANYRDFSKSLQENWISYLVIYRYCAGKPLNEQVCSLKEMKNTAPDVFEDVCAVLKSEQEAGKILLEAYWTDTLLGKCNSISEIAEVCNNYNISMNSKGLMETQVKQRWLAMTVFYSGNPLQDEIKSLMQQYDVLDTVKMSEETRRVLRDDITLRFWKCVNMTVLLDNALKEEPLDYLKSCMERLEHLSHVEISSKMVAFYYTAGAFLEPANLANHAFFRSVVENGDWSCEEAAKDFDIFESGMHRGKLHYSYSDIAVMQETIMKVARYHMSISNVFYIDYYLFGTYYKDEKKSAEEGYDFEEFRYMLDKLIKKQLLNDKTKLRLEDSQLLFGEEAVLDYRKDIRKLIVKNDPLPLRQFAEQLKGSKKSVFEFFGRRKHEEYDIYENEKGELRSPKGKHGTEATVELRSEKAQLEATHDSRSESSITEEQDNFDNKDKGILGVLGFVKRK